MHDRRGPTDAAARRVLLLVLTIAGATGISVALLGGGDAFWLCLPGALALAASCATGVGAALGAATVVLAAAAPSLASAALGPLPPAPLALVVPAASIAVLLVLKRRSQRERDALRASALTDALTGAANRRSLSARIEYEIARHARSRRSFTVLMLDLDGFKLLNDRFGHPAGDDLLVEVAVMLQRAVRDQDTVARIGGDEFCVLGPETDAEGARRLAERALTAVANAAAGIDSLQASLGTAVFPRDGASVATLLEVADQRLLAEKRRGRTAGAKVRAA